MNYFDTFYENSDGDRHLFFTGRDNIIGLRHPEYSIKNTSSISIVLYKIQICVRDVYLNC